MIAMATICLRTKLQSVYCRLAVVGKYRFNNIKCIQVMYTPGMRHDETLHMISKLRGRVSRVLLPASAAQPCHFETGV
jgi:hypothetical protein